MRMVDLIELKKNNHELTKEQIHFIIKGYNDDEESVEKLKEVIKQISPDKIIVARMDDDIFKKKLGISDEKFREISQELLKK